ncbi:hypothetical protein WJX84_001957 [Apatococcus fuscideae]|uniref:Uncharacterized protein n=1 Tax=Apatococcus fuscideae TaxID=2026836 RepID=A0AAW1T625_9CHLO
MGNRRCSSSEGQDGNVYVPSRLQTVAAARPQQGSTGIVQQSARNFFGGLRLSRSRVGATGETYQAAPGTPHNV